MLNAPGRAGHLMLAEPGGRAAAATPAPGAVAVNKCNAVSWPHLKYRSLCLLVEADIFL